MCVYTYDNSPTTTKYATEVALLKKPLVLAKGTLKFLGLIAVLMGKTIKSKEIGQIEPLTFLTQCFLDQ